MVVGSALSVSTPSGKVAIGPGISERRRAAVDSIPRPLPPRTAGARLPTTRGTRSPADMDDRPTEERIQAGGGKIQAGGGKIQSGGGTSQSGGGTSQSGVGTAPNRAELRPNDAPPAITVACPLSRRAIHGLIAAAVACGWSRPLSGDDLGSPLTVSPEQAKVAFQWLASTAVTHLPREFDGEKGWGETKRVWAGVKVGLEGARVTTHRRYRDLRHGRWVRYHLETASPNRSTPNRGTPNPAPLGVYRSDGESGLSIRRDLDVAIDGVEQRPDGSWRVDATVTAPLEYQTRVERWNLGVQWYSIRVEGELEARAKLTADVAFYADYGEIPPALVVAPRIEQARLKLDRLEVHRVSKLGRDIAENLDDVTRVLLREVWLKKENDRLADRINAKIDRRRDSLRFSLAELLRNSAPAAGPDRVGDQPRQ